MGTINVGTIGHVDHGKTTVAAALMLALAHNIPVTDTHTEMVHPRYVKVPELEPKHCMGWNTKKTKGDKKRDRAERRRKWGI